MPAELLTRSNPKHPCSKEGRRATDRDLEVERGAVVEPASRADDQRVPCGVRREIRQDRPDLRWRGGNIDGRLHVGHADHSLFCLGVGYTTSVMKSSVRAEPGGKLPPLEWGALAPLRIRALTVADGVYAGMHRSVRRGSGIEFGGQRPYVPGDDLRFVDRRSLMRHEKLMVREFETDTDRAAWVVLDRSASMGFRSPAAPGAKLSFAALLGAALCRVAMAGHDPIGLAWLGQTGEGFELAGPAGFGPATFERIVDALERASAGGSLEDDVRALERQLEVVARRARRGSVVVVFSDFLDVPDEVIRRVAVLGVERAFVAVQILDPVEVELGFSGRVRLRDIEGSTVVTTDADRVRAEYVERLEAHTRRWREAVESTGGRMLRARTSDDPVATLRAIVQAAGEARR